MVLRRHGEIIQANSRTMMLISTKLEEMGQVINSHNAYVIVLILLQKKRVDTLEAKYNRLHSLVATVQLETLSLASNNLGSGIQGTREDETVIQNRDPMEIEEPNPPHLDGGEEG
jgi:hypothetical protein